MAEALRASASRHLADSATEDPCPALVALAYEAALSPDHWPALLAALAAALGGRTADLRSVAPARIIATHGLSAAAVGAYTSGWGEQDPLPGLAEAAFPWPLVTRVMAGTAFFAGWTQPHGLAETLCLALLPPDAPQRAVLCIARPPDATGFGAAEARLLARLAPHLRRAQAVQRRLAATPASGTLAAVLDRLAQGVLLVDAAGKLAWANRAGHRLLDPADGLALDRQGRLLPASPPAAEALRHVLSLALAGEAAALPIPRPSGRPALALIAVPLPPQAEPGGRLLLLLSDPADAPADAALPRRLRALWGLTAAEALVAAAVARGAGLPDVSQSLGLAVTTARTHAQRVFAKAGLRGQAELARQVERLQLLAEEEPPACAGAQPAGASSDRMTRHASSGL